MAEDNPFAALQQHADPLDLLTEWYTQWQDRDDMPNKMGDALHVRTMIVLLGHGRIDPETAKVK